jgi:hypothetical protein
MENRTAAKNNIYSKADVYVKYTYTVRQKFEKSSYSIQKSICTYTLNLIKRVIHLVPKA